ncbi:Uncharacterized conserved protein UCP004962 [Methanobacterium lacus]|uniref:Uncharacterized conserved protein UCP004962 n=1 Tax=Methanobacterium lacus (strain AL-21) TaxID=877455 RepID=F0T6W6_METLA|nr:DUF2124 family protein [Methanobacterium lacus]ADZ09486.1 Uncharacterized conserved protein UCP004962 [Methanobacterium lacus]
MEKKTGIVGFTGAFRDNLNGISDGSKIVFTGSAAVCTPFIELLSYAIRDKNHELIFVPNADLKQTKMLKMENNLGYNAVDIKANPSNPDVVVVMGGLAMPKFGCSPDDVLNMVKEISNDHNPKIIGVCFMSIFERSGWINSIPFDVIIDTKMETTIYQHLP